MKARLIGMLAALTLGACASQVPIVISAAPISKEDEIAAAPFVAEAPKCESPAETATDILNEFGKRPVFHYRGEEAQRFVNMIMAEGVEAPKVSDVVAWVAPDGVSYFTLAYVDGCAKGYAVLPINFIDAIRKLFFTNA